MLKESISRHPSTYKLFDQGVTVGIDDIVVYQKKYKWTLRSWLSGIKIPTWQYHQDPSELLMIRGITPEILLKEIIDINYLSKITFNQSYGKYQKLTKSVSLISIILFLLLMTIPSAAARIVLSFMIFSIIIINIIDGKFIKPTETAMNEALRAIVNHVQITLNVRYNRNNVNFEIVERSTATSHTKFYRYFCNDAQHTYYHITISCIGNVISPRLSSPSNDDQQIQLEIDDNVSMPISKHSPKEKSIGNSRNVYGDDTFPTDNTEQVEASKQNESAKSSKISVSQGDDAAEDLFPKAKKFMKQQKNPSKTSPDTPMPAQTQIKNNAKEFMIGLEEVRESEEMVADNPAPFVIREISDSEEEEEEDEDDEPNDQDQIVHNITPTLTNGLPQICETREENHDADNLDLIKEERQKKKGKDYHYNWAQNVGRKRESWIDPHGDAKKADLQSNQ